MKKDEKAVLTLGFVLLMSFIYVSLYDFSNKCEDVRNNTLRLHIIANSDTENDQKIKLKVRDELLKKYGETMGQCKNLKEAEEKIMLLKRDIENTASNILKKEGALQEVKLKLENIYFPMKKYDSFSMPSGKYDAVRIEIGEAKGHNWWCVMYPPMCIPVMSQNVSQTEENIRLINEGNGIEVRFLGAELCQMLKERLRNR